MISETCETCSFQVDVFKQHAFLSPGGNDVSCDFSSALFDGGEMVTSHDARLTRSICNDECSHGSTLFPIGECVCSSTNSNEFVACTTSTSCCQYELCTLCKLDDQDHYNRCVFSHGGFSMYDRVLPRRGARSLMKRLMKLHTFSLDVVMSMH